MVDGGAVGLLDRSQAGRDPGFVGGDVLAVAAAVRVLGQGAAEPLDLADVGFALMGMSRDSEHRDIGGDGVQDEGDRTAVRVHGRLGREAADRLCPAGPSRACRGLP